MKRVSQREIALHLGVSQALVSLVLNGKREGVAEDTYQRIWDYAERSGYRRRGAERTFDGTVVPTVGYVLRAPLRLASTSNFFSEVHEGLDQYLVGNLARTTYLGSEEGLDERPLGEIIRRDPGFRGIVIMGEVGEACMDQLLSLRCPLVYVSARAPGLCHSVNVNEASGAMMMVEHLTSLGHTSFAYLGSDGPISRAEERRDAFHAAIRRAGGDGVSVRSWRRPSPAEKSGWEMAEEILSQPSAEWPTAWIAVGGLVARGALEALRHFQPELVDQVSIASLDRTRVCFEESPRITAVGALPGDLGREAGKLLLSLTGGSPVLRDLALPADLEMGETTRKNAGRLVP